MKNVIVRRLSSNRFISLTVGNKVSDETFQNEIPFVPTLFVEKERIKLLANASSQRNTINFNGNGF